MIFYKKILIGWVVVIFTYIIYQLLERRMQLTSIKEGAIFGSSETSELNGLKNTTPVLVQNINSN